MAAKTEDETKGCTYRWEIRNLSHCWLKKGERLESPPFVADESGGTEWTLWFYPKGYCRENEVNVYLHRDCNPPKPVRVSFQLAYLGEDGSILKKGRYYREWIRENDLWGNDAAELQERVFVTEREAFLPGDTLTLQCTIFEIDKRPVLTRNFFALTVLKVNRVSFDLRIDGFSSRQSGLTNNFKDEMIDFDIVLKEGVKDEKKLVIDIKWFDKKVKYVSFRMSIVDNEEENETLGTHEYFDVDLKKGIQCMWFLTKKWMENKIRYFPNDVLSLNCEHVCSNGDILYQYCYRGMTSPTMTNEVAKNSNKPYIVKESLDTIVISNDLKLMYSEGSFSDTELRDSTQTFPALKAVSSPRSPVFKKMFNHIMKEQNREYEISPLKSKCSSFLKKNLCLTNVCDALVLADLNHDVEMTNHVQDYILQHYKEVLGTPEWKDLMNTNPELAAGILYKKIYP